jgi:hypothetical protein
MIQAVLLINNQILVAEIFQVDAEPGNPNCGLMLPHLLIEDFTLPGVSNQFTLIPWMSEVAEDSYALIHTDKIIAMRDPKPEILTQYKKLTSMIKEESTKTTKKTRTRKKIKEEVKVEEENS